MNYTVYLTYYSGKEKIISSEIEIFVENLIKKYGGEKISSGGGLGGRDIDINFRSSKKVLGFISEVLKDNRIKIENVSR